MKKRHNFLAVGLIAMILMYSFPSTIFASTLLPGSILVTVIDATGTLSTATDFKFTVYDDLGTTEVTSLSSASPTKGVYTIPAPTSDGFEKGTYYVQITQDSYKHNSLTVPVTVSSPTANAKVKAVWTAAPEDLSTIPGSKVAVIGGTALSTSEDGNPVLSTNSVINLWDSSGDCYSTWSDGTTGVYKFYVPAGKYTVCADASESNCDAKAYKVTATAGQMSGSYEEVVTNRTDDSDNFGYTAPTGDKANLYDSKVFTGQAKAGCTVLIVNKSSSTSQHILGKVTVSAAKGATIGNFKITLKSCYPSSKLEVWVIDPAHNTLVDDKTLNFAETNFTMTATMPSSTTYSNNIAIKLADSAHPGNLTALTGVLYSTDDTHYTPLNKTTQYTFSSGALTILKNTLGAGSYTFKITATGYNDLITPAYTFTSPASAALTVSASAGSAAGTTKLTVTPASGDSIKYLISTSLISGMKFDTDVSGYTDYPLGSDISGVNATTNKYLAVAEVNALDKVVKFKCLTLAAANIKAGSTSVTTLEVTAQPGSTGGTTTLTVTPASGDRIMYMIMSYSIPSPTTLADDSGFTTYTLGSDISGVDATTNKYLAVAEVNALNKVVKFKCLTLVAANIKIQLPAIDINNRLTIRSISSSNQYMNCTQDNINHTVAITCASKTFDGKDNTIEVLPASGLSISVNNTDVTCNLDSSTGIYSIIFDATKVTNFEIIVSEQDKEPLHYAVTVSAYPSTADAQQITTDNGIISDSTGVSKDITISGMTAGKDTSIILSTNGQNINLIGDSTWMGILTGLDSNLQPLPTGQMRLYIGRQNMAAGTYHLGFVLYETGYSPIIYNVTLIVS